MATVSEIAQDLLNSTKGETCLCIKDIQNFTGYGRDRITRILAPLEAMGQNTGKRWYYRDVAKAIYTDGRMENEHLHRKPGRPYLRA